MMRSVLSIGLIFGMMMFLMPSRPACQDQQAMVKKGRELHLGILKKLKKIDNFYREPFVNGALSTNPLLCISVPERDWEALSESKKDALAAYVASLLGNLKSDPFFYNTGVDAKAPAASIARENIKSMSGKSWGIMVGRISPDGRDIMYDRIARAGK